MRKSEALTATWRNIELDAGVMRIDATRAKGKRSRVLPLNDSAKWVIGQLKSKGTSEFLFPSPASGRPFSTISRVWYRIRKVAGIPENVRLHDLRHSWLSLLARRGCSQVQLQHLAGHADYRTTLRYIHWSENDLCVASNLGSMIVPKEKPTATLPPAPTEASTSQPEVGAVVEQEVQSAQILVFSKAA
jgi:integrase